MTQGPSPHTPLGTDATHRNKLEAMAAALAAEQVWVARDLPLAGLARWRIGGPADLLARPRSTAEVALIVQLAKAQGLPLFVMGDGSNMLFSSAGFRGVICHIGAALRPEPTPEDALSTVGETIHGTRVLFGAGDWVPCVARRLAHAGLGGLEHICGIPGRLGGLVVMNGGSQRKGIGSHVRRVRVVTPEGGLEWRDQAALDYSYRHSTLQVSGAIVTEVELELPPRPRAEMLREMVAILADRRRKFPKNLPNCGSTFLSNPAMYDLVGPPGRAIEEAGLKGVAIGGAQVSPHHANFIVNRGGATSEEVLALIALVRETVRARTGFLMDCEARYLSPDGEEHPAHVFTDAGRFDTGLLRKVQPANSDAPADAANATG